MHRPSWKQASAALALALLACTESITDLRPSVPTLSIVPGGGDNQTGVAGATLALPLVVQLSGVSAPANGQVLNFVVTSGGGSVFANVVLTGTPKTGAYSKLSGIAEDTWTLGPTAGPQTVEARLVDPSNGATLTQAVFHATATPARGAYIRAIQGDKQTGTAGFYLRDSVRVLVTDQFGNPLGSQTIGAKVEAGGGALSTTSAVTSTNGMAAFRWSLGPTAGLNVLSVFIGSIPGAIGSSTNFVSATGVPGAAAQIVSVTGDGQHAAFGSSLPSAPTVQIRDVNSNGVAGVAVTFTVTAGGGTMAGITSVTTLSDTAGKASVGWTLGSAPGPNTLRATALGLTGSPVIFGAIGYAPLFVANFGSNSITVYEAEANGNVSPVRTIVGSNTALNSPSNIARDSQGNLYVSNSVGKNITVYASGADGNASPIRTISGANTGLSRPFALTLDTLGQVYVYDYDTRSITVFASGATGNATPLRTIGGESTRLAGVTGLQVSSTGEIYAADQDALNIKVYAPGSIGDVAPIRTITGHAGLQPTGLALDSMGQLYVSNWTGDNIRVFSASADGDASPLRVIEGPSTQLSLPIGLVLDDTGRLFVANNRGSITVYSADASGDAIPLHVISGAATGIAFPSWISF
jgi:sugar lactone lactonase YvrE